MTQYGLNYSTPGEGSHRLLSEYRNGTISIAELEQREIQLASIESSCYQQSSVREAYNEALRRYERIIMYENTETVNELKLSIGGAVARALQLEER